MELGGGEMSGRKFKREIYLVDCGRCAYSFAHVPEVTYLHCPNCGFNSESCDFPNTNSWIKDLKSNANALILLKKEVGA